MASGQLRADAYTPTSGYATGFRESIFDRQGRRPLPEQLMRPVRIPVATGLPAIRGVLLKRGNQLCGRISKVNASTVASVNSFCCGAKRWSANIRQIGTFPVDPENISPAQNAGLPEGPGPLGVEPTCIVRLRAIDTLRCYLMHARRERSTFLHEKRAPGASILPWPSLSPPLAYGSGIFDRSF
jgi:hypothetical protein